LCDEQKAAKQKTETPGIRIVPPTARRQRHSPAAESDEEECRYNRVMADHVIHISEAEAASNFADVLARVRAGAEIVIESGKLPVAVIHAPAPPRRTISECIALLPEDSTAVMDADFAKDVEAAIESHRKPLEPPAWD